MSAVLLHVIRKDGPNDDPPANASTLFDRIPDHNPLKDIVAAIRDETQDSLDDLKNDLAAWFDQGMNRVSGWYKRQAKIWIFAIAAALTIATNASSIHIAEELWRNDALRTQITAQAEAAAQEDHPSALEDADYETFQDLPIGWDNVSPDGHDWFKRVVGWLITTAAISLGAPFWFDLLGKVANLRGAGARAEPAKTRGS